MEEHKISKKLLHKISLVILTLFVILIAGCAPNPSAVPEVCETKECFEEKANLCKTVSIQIEESYGLVEYSADNCSFAKKIITLNDSPKMKQLVEGKKLFCNYEQGNFDKRWMTSVALGLEPCYGELREMIGQLIIFS